MKLGLAKEERSGGHPRTANAERPARPGAGRNRSRHRKGGHRRAARPGPRHPSRRPRQRARCALATLAARSAVPVEAGRRRAGAAVAGDRDHRLLLRRGAARQRRQAQRPAARHDGGGPHARPAAAAGHRRRRRRRQPTRRQRAWPGSRSGSAPVDGRMEISSPPGGPTVVTVELPTDTPDVRRNGDADRDRRGLWRWSGPASSRSWPTAGTRSWPPSATRDGLSRRDRRAPTRRHGRGRAACRPATPTRGCAPRSRCAATIPALGVLVFSQYIETRYAADLLGASSGRAARRASATCSRTGSRDVSEFVDALTRVAAGGTALDPRWSPSCWGEPAGRRAGRADRAGSAMCSS